MKCFFWMALVLVCVVATAEARTPEWLIACPEGCGVLNTKPDKDGNCRYTVGDKVFKFPQMKDAEVMEQRKFFGWDINVKRTIRPTWSVDVSPLVPPNVDLFSIINIMQQENIEARLEQGMPIDPEFQSIDWMAVYKRHAEVNAEAEKEWSADIEASFVRVAGKAERPAGMLVTLVQQTPEDGEIHQFIIDADTETIWKRP